MPDNPKMKVDLVFEGGGAKGMVLIGALEVLFGAGYSPGRLLGTSAGAITALALAAGYTIPELNAALSEKDEQGKPIFTTFLGDPPVLDAAAIGRSSIRTLLAEINMSLVWDPVEKRLDDRLVNTATGAHDNLAKALYKANVVRLPAGGYETTQFGMSDKEREALVNAGREAMIAFLGISPAGGATPAMPGLPAFDSGTIASPNFAISDPLAVDYANNAAANLLGQQ